MISRRSWPGPGHPPPPPFRGTSPSSGTSILLIFEVGLSSYPVCLLISMIAWRLASRGARPLSTTLSHHCSVLLRTRPVAFFQALRSSVSPRTHFLFLSFPPTKRQFIPNALVYKQLPYFMLTHSLCTTLSYSATSEVYLPRYIPTQGIGQSTIVLVVCYCTQCHIQEYTYRNQVGGFLT